VHVPSEAISQIKIADTEPDIEAIFRTHYERIARVIARVTGDRPRAEELAVEVFLKLWRTPRAQGEKAGAWLYRAAVRKGLDELRHRTRRTRYERLLGFVRHRPATPEEICTAAERRERVRRVLAVLDQRHAELLLLRSDGLSYDQVASALDLNPASVGTLLSRAADISEGVHQAIWKPTLTGKK
jgi:RNA polymerase sigma-70 factor, ECF subfamily